MSAERIDTLEARLNHKIIKDVGQAAVNPWVDLAHSEPFISPLDESILAKRNDRLDHLHFEIMPSPYMGNLDNAQVVFLALNPGFEQGDVIAYNDPAFAQQTRLNFTHGANPSFYALDSKFQDSVTHQWWIKKIKGLVEVGIPLNQLSEKIMSVQYFPYHSVTYKPLSETLPSQEYSFHLVRKAIKRGKTIVMMRSEKLWTEAVPELKDTPFIKLRNVRNPVITSNNMDEPQFKRILAALENDN